MIRDGYVAIWKGSEYEASPTPEGEVRLYTTQPAEGFAETRPGRYRRSVPASEIERLRYVRTACRWRGERFIVVGEHETWLRVEYVGGRGPVAERLGLDRIDHGVWQTWAPRAEVEELHEEFI
ncbi:hypothetical protein ABGB12_00840 [Actinocorallia sp. B10E7]|uniref:hypothetical protein n=1 Tax=Actinocorallia sp. B10E7 TaxID=3153558 RepID=UPI00325EE0DD